MDTVIVIVTGATWLLVLLLLGIGIRQYWLARRRKEELLWINEQLERAIAQIQSGEEEEVLTGLQTIGALRDRRAYVHVLPVVSGMVQNARTKRVREAAGLALDTVADTLAEEGLGDPGGVRALAS